MQKIQALLLSSNPMTLRIRKKTGRPQTQRKTKHYPPLIFVSCAGKAKSIPDIAAIQVAFIPNIVVNRDIPKAALLGARYLER